MRIIVEEAEIRRAARSFMQHLKKGCDPVTARLCWGGPAQETEVSWNPRFRFWSACRETGGGCWIKFGMGEPHGRAAVRSVCDMRFSFEGFDPALEGLFARFGSDVLALHTGVGAASGGDGESLAGFLELHGHGPTVHELEAPGGATLPAAVVSSATSPELAFDVFRFVSAVNDHRQWAAQGLLAAGPPEEPRPGRCEDAEHAQAPSLAALMLAGVREQLEKLLPARAPGLAVGASPAGGLALRSRDGLARAVVHVTADLSPESLFCGVGRLLLPRENLRAAKFLVMPGSPGPHLAQTLYMHGVHAVPCKLTQETAVVLDLEAILAAAASA